MSSVLCSKEPKLVKTELISTQGSQARQECDIMTIIQKKHSTTDKTVKFNVRTKKTDTIHVEKKGFSNNTVIATDKPARAGYAAQHSLKRKNKKIIH